MKYLSLDPNLISQTVEALRRRIAERFPDSGLSRVAGELAGVARDAVRRSEEVRRPNRLLRGGVVLLVLAFLTVVPLLLLMLSVKPEPPTISDLIQDIDSALASMVFLGASGIFLWTLDARLKRRRVLQALHELRALAHIVDMHQLTKDPEVVLRSHAPTVSSPVRAMNPFELGRYLDYSSEMLSLIAKIAALYVQGFEDPVALGAVDEVEDLTSGLSRKIWQKIMLLDRTGAAAPQENAG